MSRLLAVAVLALAGCTLGGDDTTFATARRGELIIGVDVSGQLASTESNLLGPPPVADTWNFKIAFMAQEGNLIRAGQPVLGFDDSELRRKLEEYQNEFDSATKELEAHRAGSKLRAREGELAVAEALAGEKKASLKAEVGADIEASITVEKAKLDHEFAQFATGVARRKAKAQARQDQAELERLLGVKKRAEERITQLQQSIGAMRVPAPIDGTVLWVTDWQGNKKKVGDNAWRAEKIIDVVSLDKMKADGEVDEMDASRVSVGQRVSLRLDANADVELAGEVVKISEAVQRRSAEDPLKVVKAEIALAAQDEVELRPGMRFRGTIETDRIADVVLVPLATVHATAEGAVVYRKAGSDTEVARVTLGRRNREMVEVLSGLEPGDRVAFIERAGAGAEAE
jgi:HlyD family secretion protein